MGRLYFDAANILNFNELHLVLRLVIAAVCGVLIGYERKNRAKEAGVRTHCMVACASALMMVLSKYAYSDVMSQYGELMKIDPSRIASGVVSGIGFLGAGMIFVHKKTVTGLTTAAGIWATSGIGMAIGAGMYITGGAATVIILLIQIILHLTPKHHAQVLYAEENKLNIMPSAGNLAEVSFSDESDGEGNIVYTVRFKTSEDNKKSVEEDKKD